MIYNADLHIHTVLSPCASLDMSPLNIIKEAKRKNIQIIGITDHNSTKNAIITEKIGQESEIFVLKGIEINTKEEIHCLSFFDTAEQLTEFDEFICQHLPFTKNDTKKFGYQLVVNEKEEIIEEVESLLIMAINLSINDVMKKVNQLNGIFIPAHIDKSRNSIISQLGFIPNDLQIKTVELSCNSEKNNICIPDHYQIIYSSDAHSLSDIGKANFNINLNDINFQNIKNFIEKR